MDQPRRVVAIVLATAFVLLTTALGAASGAPTEFLILDTAGGMTFVAAGAVAWRRRPEVLTGPLLVLSGVLWSVGELCAHGSTRGLAPGVRLRDLV